MPCRNGECSTLPVPGSRRNPSVGTSPQSSSAASTQKRHQREAQATTLRRRESAAPCRRRRRRRRRRRPHPRHRAAEARRDHSLRDPPAEPGDQERRDGHEVVVRRGAHDVRRVDDARRFLRQAGEQRVDRAEHEIGAVAARYAGERGREAEHRMAAGRLEDQRCQRHQQHVADFARRIRHHAANTTTGVSSARGELQHEHAHQRADQARDLGDADADHRHQHRAERREAREVGDEAGQDPVQPVDGQQAHRLDQLAGGRVRHGEVELRGDARDTHDQHGEQRKQRGRVGQRVADPLDHVEEAVDGLATRG